MRLKKLPLLKKRGSFMFRINPKSFPAKKISHQSGVTLVELILSMVIISIALTGVFSVMNLTVSHSADPVVNHQAIAVAEACLEEILLDSFSSLTNCTMITPPSGYSVSATIGNEALGSISSGSADAKKIVVSALYGSETIELVGYRTNY